MGFGSSVTQAIFFIAAAIVALALVGVMTAAITGVMNSFNQKSSSLSEQIKTDISIISDTCYIGGYSSLYVKNTGGSFLDANTTAIFEDGAFIPVSSIEIFDNGGWTDYSSLGVWEPTQVARFNTTTAFGTGYHRLRVVSENGVYDSVYFSDC